MENEEKKMKQKWKNVGYNTIYSEKKSSLPFQISKEGAISEDG